MKKLIVTAAPVATAGLSVAACGSEVVTDAGNAHVAGPNFIDLHVFNTNDWTVTATQVAQRVHGQVFTS
jgi:hypothetical protein